MVDLGRIAGTYTNFIAGIGGIDAVTNVLTLVFLAACVALALRGPAVAFGATMLAWALTGRLPVFAAIMGNPDEAQILAGTRRLYYDPIFWRSVDGVTSGPLNYYSLAALRLFGLPLNFATARAANLLFLWGAVVLLWLAGREFMPEWAARLSVLPWLAAAIGFRFGEFLQYSSECFPLLLGSLAVWLLVRERWFPLGIVLVSMPLAKLQALPIAAVLGVSAAYRIWRGERRDALRLAGGAAAALLALTVFLTVFGLWHDFSQSYLWNNLSYIDNTQGALGDRDMHHDLVDWSIGRYFAFIANSAMASFLAWMVLWIVPVLAWRRGASILGVTAAGLCAAGLYAVWLPGRAFPHYLLLLMLPVTLSGMVALAAAINNSSRPKLVAAVFVALTVVAPTFQAMVYSPSGSLTAIAASTPAIYSPISGRLNAWAKPGDLVAVWGWAAELNILTGTVPATRDAQSQRQIEAGPQREYYRHRYVQDLRANPPRVFADAVGPQRFVFQDRAAQGYESIPELREFIDANYELKDDVQGVRVFARKGAERVDSREAVAPLPLTIAAGTEVDRFYYGGGRFEVREENAPAGYRSARFCRSTCEYSIPLENGCYRVRLHFIELICARPGLRIFTVTMNQATLLRDFDVFRQAGAAGVPVVMEFAADVKEGRLTIGLLPQLREADISRIEVVKVNHEPSI